MNSNAISKKTLLTSPFHSLIGLFLFYKMHFKLYMNQITAQISRILDANKKNNWWLRIASCETNLLRVMKGLGLFVSFI